MSGRNMVFAILTFSAVLSSLVVVSRADDDAVDLQELLRSVSTTMKGLKNVMEKCNSSLQTLSKPRDCADLWHSGIRKNGVYRVWPEKWETVGSFDVYCDMVTDGGGWTVFQKRGDFSLPKDYFYKTWREYKDGFGQLDKEFWLGNDKIFALTNQGEYQLRVDLWDMNNIMAYAKYKRFWIENEEQRYMLKISGYSGNAGDSLSEHSGAPFTTKDRKNDSNPPGSSCATLNKGAWWYVKCHVSNLNGLNLRGPHKSFADGIEWYNWKGYHYSLGATEMKIRPVDF